MTSAGNLFHRRDAYHKAKVCRKSSIARITVALLITFAAAVC